MHGEATTSGRAGKANGRAEAARINGRRSSGPVSAEGKARSSQNARRHGLCAAGPGDEAERLELEALKSALAQELRPDSLVERALVEQAANALFRIARADRIETEILTRGIESDDGALMGADLFLDPAAQRALSLLLRYRAAAERQLSRARAMLAELRKAKAPDPLALLLDDPAERTERLIADPALPLNRAQRRWLQARARKGRAT